MRWDDDDYYGYGNQKPKVTDEMVKKAIEAYVKMRAALEAALT